ncbi:MAG: class I SAM-dependent RNA methyltransferase [Anaerolineae bacterium]|nr:class I SAM-dependent RNA methyltransferase [Gemmatimonadaceae bacterium]
MSTVELRIESVAAGGDGVARTEGLVVFVPRSAPGDVGTASIGSRKRSRFARAELRELRVASPVRVDPPCRHFTRDKCGGCQLQHISYAAQLDAKSRIISDAFERIGRRTIGPIAVRPSASQWKYRSKLTLALKLRNGAPHESGSGLERIAGLHPFDDPASVFPMEECPITNDAVIDLWREILRFDSLLPSVPSLRAAVRVDESAATFILEGGDSWPEFERFKSALPKLDTVWWAPTRGTRRLMTEGGTNANPGASFSQVNASVAAELQQHVIQRTMAYKPDRVIDAYSGVGEIAVMLAQAGVETTAVELDPQAAAWCARNLPSGSRSIAGRVEVVLPAVLPAEVILLNPPRAGVDAKVCETLEHVRQSVRAIIYTSCDPATLARDVARLPGYRICRVDAFDMFPQTAHVETVCELVPGEE